MAGVDEARSQAQPERSSAVRVRPGGSPRGHDLNRTRNGRSASNAPRELAYARRRCHGAARTDECGPKASVGSVRHGRHRGPVRRRAARGRAGRGGAVRGRFADRSQRECLRPGVRRIAPAYAGYEALASDPEVDAVYVATPNPSHAAHCELALAHGKAVLCEKPFTTSAKEAQAVIDAARRAQVFCMEAMWMRSYRSCGS